MFSRPFIYQDENGVRRLSTMNMITTNPCFQTDDPPRTRTADCAASAPSVAWSAERRRCWGESCAGSGEVLGWRGGRPPCGTWGNKKMWNTHGLIQSLGLGGINMAKRDYTPTCFLGGTTLWLNGFLTGGKMIYK